MLASLALACMPSLEPVGDTALTCTTEAVASVEVLVVAQGFGPVEGADITYAGESEGGECEEVGDGRYLCGWEVAGILELQIDAEGFESQSVETFVQSDECHVETSFVDVHLEPIECGADAAAIVVKVFDGAGDSYLQQAEVGWSTGGEPVPCDGSGVYACWSPAGEVALVAEAEGYATEHLETFVEEDACGPVTQLVELTMHPLDTTTGEDGNVDEGRNDSGD